MKKSDSYKVNEIFYSLQGEGANTGRPAVLIRFAGCNIACPFCDTQHQNGDEMTAEQIRETISRYPTDFVVLTGGEPGLQIDDRLINTLHEQGYKVAIETNGTCVLPEGIDWVTCSPKEGSRIILKWADEVKVVYTGQDVEKWYENIDAKHYYLQPCSCQNTEEVVRYCLEHPQWALSLQTHKLLDIR